MDLVRRGMRWALPLGLALGLVAPTVSASAANVEVHRDGFYAELGLEGSNGYNISVYVLGHKRIWLEARKGGLSATYVVPARASRKGIEADLGPFGEISVRFDAAVRRPTRKSRLCRGKRAIAKAGTFRGTIRFAGEREFTAVDASEARGYFHRSFRQVCEKPEKKKQEGKPKRPPGARAGGPGPTFTGLIARSRLEGRATEFGYFGFGIDLGGNRPAVPLFSLAIAVTREQVGKVLVSKSAFRPGGEHSLQTSKPGAKPETATVSLPKPFSGAATYTKEAGSPPAWAGTFAVRLPGAGTVPLTGEGFASTLCRSADSERINACLKRLEPNAQGSTVARLLTQGSGSQSQVLWDDRLSWSR